jgi:CheY-specific phosphatase CheX
MAEDPKGIMADVLASVLENMTFTFIEPPEDEGLHTSETEFLHATIEFDGPAVGELGIAAPQALCMELTAGILGLDPDDGIASDNIRDTLGELLNVTCGNFATSMFGDETKVNQSIPQVKKINSSTWASLIAGAETVKFIVDDVPLIAHVSVRESR